MSSHCRRPGDLGGVLVGAALLLGAQLVSAATVANAAAPATGLAAKTTVRAGGVSALTHDTWTELPPAPIAGRSAAAAVWDGSAMLVWGGAIGAQGSQLAADGASYDPATRSWALLPPSPLSPRADMAYLWTGTDLFIWGGQSSPAGNGPPRGTGALFNPRTGAWQMLPPAPISARSGAQALRVGPAVVVLGGWAGRAVEPGLATRAAAYYPASNHWRRLPPAPKLRRGRAVALTAVAGNGRIYLFEEWSRIVHHGSEPGIESGLRLIDFDLANWRWSAPAARGPGPPFDASQMLWTGSRLLVAATEQCPFDASCALELDVHGYQLAVANHRWAAIPHGPADALDPQAIWTGAALLEFDSTAFVAVRGGPIYPGQAAAWNPGSGRWARLPAAPLASQQPQAVWAGDRLLVWGEMFLPSQANRPNPPRLEAAGLQLAP